MNEAPAWETCKENVLPVKRGRSAKGLSEALAKPVLDDGTEAAERERLFESQLSACAENDSVTKLNIYIQHIKWFRDAFPTSSDKVFALLEVTQKLFLCSVASHFHRAECASIEMHGRPKGCGRAEE